MSHRPVVKKDPKTGQVTVPATPSASTDAASKSYVDAISSSGTWTPTYSVPVNCTVSTNALVTPTWYQVENRVRVGFVADVAYTSGGGFPGNFNFNLNPASLPVTPAATPNSFGQVSWTQTSAAPAGNMSFPSGGGYALEIGGTWFVGMSTDHTTHPSLPAIIAVIFMEYDAA